MTAEHELEYQIDTSRRRASDALERGRNSSVNDHVGSALESLAHVAFYAVDVWRTKR